MVASHVLRLVPNIITVARLMLVPLAVEMILAQAWMAAFAVFAIAGLSDAVDGFLARRWRLQSELGAYLDPLADKALLISMYVALAVARILPAWTAILVVSRDLMIIGAVVVSWVLNKPVEIRPLFVSKANTVAQIGLAGAVLAAMAFGWTFGAWFSVSLWTVAVLTLASTAAYLTQWLRHMSR